MPWVRLIEVSRCAVGAGTFVPCGDQEFAVFVLQDPDRVIVIDNTCPHAGGNLAGGEVVDGVVSCPWHHWKFELATGVCTHSPKAFVARRRAEVREEFVWVEIP